jgi:tetratricopeptide (TPR) repeat protein
MPFGKKSSTSGGTIDFDAVYETVIAPAIAAAELEPLRADEELGGGIIHKPMYERLILCEFAVADLTTANANVFYELGVRHALRPASTVLVYADRDRLPFDVALLRAVPYRLTAGGRPSDAEAIRNALTERLIEARDTTTDSPIFQLVEGLPTPELDHTKTDVFRDLVRYSAGVKERLAEARKLGVEAVRAVEGTLGPIEDAEAGVVVDLFLSYRAVEGWDDMVSLVEKMSAPLAATVLVQEQLALALNRGGDGDKAERVLKELLARRGPSSETYGILGRVYKDRWSAAVEQEEAALARGALKQAIETYLKGFETDWRDAYPGVNAVTLMAIRDSADPKLRELLPIVEYAVERKIESSEPDYWDYATRLELAVIAKDEARAQDALGDALAAVREPWEPKSTADNLARLRKAREDRGDAVAWAQEIEAALMRASES